MADSNHEIASQIVIAWIRAIGSASAGVSSPQTAATALEILTDQDKITELYDKVYKVVRNAFTNSKES